MSTRSHQGSRAQSAHSASRPKPLDKSRAGAGSAQELLPALSVTGSSFHKATAITRDTKPAKPPGIPRSQTASSVNNRRRLGNPDAKEDKNTGVFTIDDLQRLRETVGFNGAKTDAEMEAEFQAQQRKEMMEKSRARVKNWPNTIENLRNKRVEDKYRKLEEEEVGHVD